MEALVQTDLKYPVFSQTKSLFWQSDIVPIFLGWWKNNQPPRPKKNPTKHTNKNPQLQVIFSVLSPHQAAPYFLTLHLLFSVWFSALVFDPSHCDSCLSSSSLGMLSLWILIKLSLTPACRWSPEVTWRIWGRKKTPSCPQQKS